MKKISRTKLESLLQKTNGKFFTAIATKVDGSERVFNARLKVHKGLKGGVNKVVKPENAYMVIWDRKAESFRTLNLATVSEVHTAGEKFEVV